MSSETTESTSFYELLAWLEVNKKKLAYAGGGAVALVLAIMTYNYLAAQKELHANDALFAFQPSALLAQGAGPSSDKLLKVAQEFRKTSAGERAMYLGAGALFIEGKYLEAQQQFASFLTTYEGSALAAGAYYGIAASLEAQDKNAEALERYQRIITQFPSHSEAIQARLAVARLQEAMGKPEAAMKMYEEMIHSSSMTAWGNVIGMARERFMEQHPDLAAQAAAAAASTGTNASAILPMEISPKASSPTPAK